MTDNKHWLLGVDGGGTSCRVRLCDASGNTVGQGQSGSANVRLGPETVFNAINQATAQAFTQARLDASILSKTFAGFGLAGAVSVELNQSILEYPHSFADICIDNDAAIACLGAHRGEDGGIIILGTGSCAVIKSGSEFKKIGGWGFSISDQGSGARLGQELARAALMAFEEITNASPLSKAFMRLHNNNPAKLLHWSDQAKPRDFAALAPMIIEYYHRRDPLAENLINSALEDVILLVQRSYGMGAKRLCVMGGLAEFITPLLKPLIARELPADATDIIVPAQGDALDGAIIMAAALADSGRIIQ